MAAINEPEVEAHQDAEEQAELATTEAEPTAPEAKEEPPPTASCRRRSRPKN